MIRGIMYQQMFTLCFLTASLHWTAELNTQSESVIKSFLYFSNESLFSFSYFMFSPI